MVSIVLAVGLSIDAFAAGLALGFDGIRLSAGAKWMMILCPTAAAALSLCGGRLLARALPVGWAARLGAALLLAMGVWLVLGALLRRAGQTRKSPLVQWRIPGWGVTLCLLCDPVSGDQDRSGSIDTAEALPMSAALSADLLVAGVGLGAAMEPEYSWLLPPLVGLCHLALLWCGLRLGGRLPRRGGGLGGFCSGGVLAVLGLLRLLSN